jgi:hypothetical protein
MKASQTARKSMALICCRVDELIVNSIATVAGIRLLKRLPVRASIAQGEETMNSSGVRSRLAALVTAGIICVCLLSLSSATAWARVGSITEFTVPTAGSEPFGITVGPDRNLWFTESAFLANKIGRITTS